MSGLGAMKLLLASPPPCSCVFEGEASKLQTSEHRNENDGSQ